MTSTVVQFFPNLYRDSVALMQLSARLGRLPGVAQASAQMATRANLEQMAGAGLLDAVPEPRPNDVLLVLRGEAEALQGALQQAAALFDEKVSDTAGDARSEPLRSVQMAWDAGGARANLVLISTPGDYAAAEAMKALRLGMNAMLFSDNVSEAAEIALKQFAQSRNLLVMGPDCGTAIIDGLPLAFANVVARGDIGVVAASGTGLQQVTCLIDQYGRGITHAIGTGGHDLSEAVGGITMLTALAQLADDPATRVIVLISKPPAARVADKVLAAARQTGKPVVACFLGADPDALRAAGVVPANTLEDAARLAAALSDGTAPRDDADADALRKRAAGLAARLTPGQTQLRGLYCGGTFCYEALLMLQDALPDLRSNTPTGKVARVDDLWMSRGNTILDLGDDDFTRGRPHPMIDPGLRNERIVAEAADPGVAIILLDFVLGYGAHEDPAGNVLPSLRAAREAAAAAGREVIFIGHVCGTGSDPQNLGAQRAVLAEAGVQLADSNAQAVRLCRAVLAAHAAMATDGKGARA
ncbi:acyl-CoA synthetase FdrA [Cupriavidus agavae]|uniref:Succinyl-CoA synthetase alpha subunit n=1 Tax=Cupriavidus agavae TaxID=1001822 RepID=A0A4Q7S078_9BURK|nr:acyl-CoA synthetase FdrA [Cupriavidus agavae]RZT38710.1 succinyl-CoA synthetase alpha subunit [Cupriavidus agavae]